MAERNVSESKKLVVVEANDDEQFHRPDDDIEWYHNVYRDGEGEDGEDDGRRLAKSHSLEYGSEYRLHKGKKENLGRRKTIFELDSFANSAVGVENLHDNKPKELIRFSESLAIPSIARVSLSPLTQKILGCVIDTNVTTEFPWIHIDKEIIIDNLELHPDSSDFLPIMDKLMENPEQKILLSFAPTSAYPNDFYVCLTPASRVAALGYIETQREMQQQQIISSVLKHPKPWHHLGSAEVIEETHVKKTRPLFEVEVESTMNELRIPMTFADKVEKKRATCVEIVPHREVFDNIERVLVSKSAARISEKNEREVQTLTAMPINRSCQCVLDQEAVGEMDVNYKSLENFVKTQTKELYEEIRVNSTWNMYKNDFNSLVELGDSSAGEKLSIIRNYEERQNFYNRQHSKGGKINDLSWHPTWTGVMVAAYTKIAKCEYISGPKIIEEPYNYSSQVLVWSFDDSLHPKLVLESKREVTVVSFCPTDGNIIIGGCINGQTVIWDITGKIEEVETIVVQTSVEAKNYALMKSLLFWMKESRSSSFLRPTATSSLELSQKGPITYIKWLSPYHKLDERGILHELDGDDETELSTQCMTSSEDGTIAFWDLKWRPPPDKAKGKGGKKKKSRPKPLALVQSISPLKVLDGVFKPLYILVVQNPGETRNAIITGFTYAHSGVTTEQVPPFSTTDDISVRRYYKIKLQKEQGSLANAHKIFVGTARGVCGLVSWEGFEFSTGMTLNRETCKWVWQTQIHDGPVYKISRSKFLKDIILTVGGQIFAIWNEDFSEPLLWRKANTRYTSCVWDSNKPSVFVLGRNDGTVETWDLKIKSYEPNIVESLSGKIITGVFAHQLPLNPQCIAICDYNGALRLLIGPEVFSDYKETNLKWMRHFVDREVVRLQDYNTWKLESCKENTLYAENLKNMRGQKKKPDAEAAEKMMQEEERIQAAKNSKKKARQNLIDKLQARWVNREMMRMEKVILEKKGLNAEELEKRRKPILRIKREARDKEAKHQQILESADDYFNDIVNCNFPHYKNKIQETEKQTGEEQQPTTDTSSMGDCVRTDEKIMEEYKEIERKAMLSMQHNPDELPKLDWPKFIREGLHRRKSMDVNLKTTKDGRAWLEEMGDGEFDDSDSDLDDLSLKSLEKEKSAVSVSELKAD